MPSFGKYKARVVNVEDPQKRARVKVECPAIYGQGLSPWCEPCVPIAGDMYGDMCVPKLGETIWIEFERGDPEYPIWVGGWYSKFKAPEKGNIHVRVISYYDNIILMTHNHDTMEDQIKIYRLDQSIVLTDNEIVATSGASSVRINPEEVVLTAPEVIRLIAPYIYFGGGTNLPSS